MRPTLTSPRPVIGCVIRFRNSARTLPSVLQCLAKQTLQPDFILGIDNNSSDDSADILIDAGASVLEWTKPYSHPAVLNFAMERCPTDLVLLLSSHTTLNDEDALERMVAEMEDPQMACVSGKWDDSRFYSDTVTWEEMKQKGMLLGSVYSNSMGVIRRSFWEETPFDESMGIAEDYGWSLEQMKRGRKCRRLAISFGYLRNGNCRTYELAREFFRMSRSYGLKTVWLGPKLTLWKMLGASLRCCRVSRSAEDRAQWVDHVSKFRAWFEHVVWRQRGKSVSVDAGRSNETEWRGSELECRVRRVPLG